MKLIETLKITPIQKTYLKDVTRIENESKKTLNGIDNADNFEKLLDKMVKDGIFETNLNYISDSMYNKGPKYSQIYDYILN